MVEEKLIKLMALVFPWTQIAERIHSELEIKKKIAAWREYIEVV